jgi:1-deoxy-D-xylulose-5-phosphate synthase
VTDLEVLDEQLSTVLDSVTSPARLRELTHAQLLGLAAELRAFLVSSVATTGGHLGSNLGVVVLTIALHRALDSPRDAIVWDTGHQAYVHKVLTGRAASFATLRQRGGMSGYPRRAESEHDLVENSHASTGLSYAHGLAVARRLRGTPGRVTVVIGDGALTGGLAYEALSNLGTSKEDVLVLLNDNGRSYAPTVSPLTSAGEAAGPRSTAARSFFESLGLAYDGPVDGHSLCAMDDALRGVLDRRGPRVLHVHTQKGRGYPPAELDDDRCLHDVAPFDPLTGLARGARRRTYTDAFAQAMVDEGARRPELVAITAAMGSPTGLEPFRRCFPVRFFDVGIAEQHAVTMAAGMAMAGLRPAVAIYSTFLNRAWDQIYLDVGLHRLPVVFCIDRAGVTGDDGPSHHGLLDMVLLAKVPGMTVLAPSSEEELAVMLRQALDTDAGPVAIRWPKSEAPTGSAVGSGVRARRIQGGRDVCLLGVGKLVGACEDAGRQLAARGIAASVWDARAVAPLDPTMIEDARRHRLVVTVEDGVLDGGFGSRVITTLAQDGGPMPQVTCCGVPRTYLPHGAAGQLLADLGLDGPGLVKTVLAAGLPSPSPAVTTLSATCGPSARKA